MAFDRKLGKSFKKVGESYHIGRKEYLKELIEDIIRISNINKEGLILDVGCGTGKSTIPFARRGYNILGIDISKNMLAIAKKLSINYKNSKYKQMSFEKLKSKEFDLILFGTAIHWLDPKNVYKKSGSILKKKGYIAIFWEPIGSLCNKIKSLGLEPTFLKYCPNYPQNLPKNPTKSKLEGITESKLFSKTLIKKYRFVQKYNREEFLSLVKSYSWVISLKEKERDNLLNEVEKLLKKGNLKFKTDVYLVMAKRK